jgi:hydroxyacylglutathione hydrolase
MQLSDETKIYCGHEYTLSNGRFALTMEPDNSDLQARMRDVQSLRDSNQPTIPSTIGLEKKTNPFLRPDSPQIRATLDMRDADEVAVFGEIRNRKDSF